MSSAEFLLVPRGLGRYPTAIFLSVWLTGWLAGESLVIWFLVRGAIALLTGTPPGPNRNPLVLGPALAIAAFLLVWLFFWTIGGYAAARHLLELLWSSDRIAAGEAALQVKRRLGPFRWTEEFPRGTLRRIYLTDRERALTAETDAGPVLLSSLGTPADREGVAASLREELGVPEEPSADAVATVPEPWEEIVTPEGERAVVGSLAARRKQARVALAIAVVLGAVALVLVREASRDPKLTGLAITALVAASGMGWGAERLRSGRIEWRLGVGSITRRRRYRSRVHDRFEGVRLELTRQSDSDGDDWFRLVAVAADAPEVPPSTGWGTGRKTIVSVLRDPTVPRRLGHWLSRRARIPFEDRTTKAALALEREMALVHLRESGAIGRRVAGWIERIERKKR
jgi:hypothetical protein